LPLLPGLPPTSVPLAVILALAPSQHDFSSDATDRTVQTYVVVTLDIALYEMIAHRPFGESAGG
jgi:hypothetical protein